MNCPHCQTPIEESAILTAAAKLYAARRKNPRGGKGGGRPVVVKVCGCGFTGGAVEMRKHKCKRKRLRL